MFNVINIKNLDRGNPRHVYCGRPSKLGNPFPLKDERKRDAVCDEFHHLFHSELIHDPEYAVKLLELLSLHKKYGVVALACFCAPKRCHCDTIATFLNDSL